MGRRFAALPAFARFRDPASRMAKASNAQTPMYLMHSSQQPQKSEIAWLRVHSLAGEK
jgi:hypothetical protein